MSSWEIEIGHDDSYLSSIPLYPSVLFDESESLLHRLWFKSAMMFSCKTHKANRQKIWRFMVVQDRNVAYAKKH